MKPRISDFCLPGLSIRDVPLNYPHLPLNIWQHHNTASISALVLIDLKFLVVSCIWECRGKQVGEDALQVLWDWIAFTLCSVIRDGWIPILCFWLNWRDIVSAFTQRLNWTQMIKNLWTFYFLSNSFPVLLLLNITFFFFFNFQWKFFKTWCSFRKDAVQ